MRKSLLILLMLVCGISYSQTTISGTVVDDGGMPLPGANVIVEGGLNNVELEGTWNVSGNEYSLNGNGPQLFIKVKMGLGNLQLVSN